MHSLRWKFFAFFIGLGLLASLGVGLVMYIQYDKYIKTTYREKLVNVLQLIDVDYHPVLSGPDNLVRLGTAGSQEYWDVVASMKKIADILDITHIYYVRRSGNTFQFIFASAESPDTPVEEVFSSYEEHDVPQAMEAAYRTRALQITQAPFTNIYGTFVSAYIPIINNGTVMGVLGADYDIGYILTLKRMAQIALAVSLLLSGVVAAVFALTVSSSLIKPIRNLKDFAQTLAKGDLTQGFIMKGKDELAEMSQTLNQAQEGIKKLIILIKKQAVTLSDTGNELASNMTQTAAAVNQITANIQSIKGRVINQSASVSQTHATMEQVVSNINKLDTLAGKQTANVSQASSAIEEMAANIQSVVKTLAGNSTNVQTLQEASEAGRSGLQEVAGNIQEIARESEGLLEINSVMQNIASQTNLLSMNAAIEAAHAGESGKGFAVVADEIRKLAENSSEQSKTIGNVLKKIKGSIDKITSSTETVLTRFEAIDSSVRVVSDQEEHIRGAMEEQGMGSRQIVQVVGEVSQITQQVKTGSEEMLEGSREVIAESNNLEKATQEITSGMNEMASGAEEINGAVNHVNGISDKNRQEIDLLLEEVARFKIE